MKWLLLATAISSPLWAATSVPLSLDHARMLLAVAGVNVGKVFADEDNRYLVSRIESHAKGPNTFLIEVEITPLPRHIQ